MAGNRRTAEQVFEAELARCGLRYARLGDLHYMVDGTDGTTFEVRLNNVAQTYERDGDRAAVTRMVTAILSTSADAVDPPAWDIARHDLFPSLEATALDIGDTGLSRPMSDEARLVLMRWVQAARHTVLVTRSDLATWGVTEEQAWQAAETALDRIMRDTTVVFSEQGGIPLGLIEAPEPHKAALTRAPSLRAKVEKRLGWPIYAVALARDFVYLLSRDDQDRLGDVGRVVLHEIETAGYPITAEVWEISDEGIHVIGSFAPPAGP